MLRFLKTVFKSKADHDKDQFCHGYSETMRALIVPDIVAPDPTGITQAYNDGCELAKEDYVLNNAIQKALINKLQTDVTNAKVIEEMLRERVNKAEERVRSFELKANSLA